MKAFTPILTLLLCAPAWSAPAAAPSPEPAKAKWNVNAPPGPASDVVIDTRSGTWMSVAIHPEGKRLVFDLLGDIYELRIGGKGASELARPLTSGLAWDMQPRYSPDGEHIVFTSDRDGGDNIWRMASDGSKPTQITRERFRLLNSPDWTPDGRFIVARKHFTSQRSIGAGEIWLYDRKGGDGVQMTKRANEQKDLGEPALSPDGHYLYYSLDATPGKVFEYNKDPNRQIYAIERLDRRTGRVERLLGGPGGAIRPTPSPDGKTMAYIRRVRGRSVLLLRDLRSGAERRIKTPLDRDLQETWAIHGVYPAMAWSPDSRTLFFSARGALHRLDAASGVVADIPFRVKDKRRIIAALRTPVAVAPKRFEVRALRQVRVSPNGKQVVYVALGHLWLRDLAGGKARRLTRQSERFEFHPAWSRDGKSIVYTTWNDDKFGDVRVIGADGEGDRVVSSEPGHYVEPAFSPDGRALVWRKTRGGHLRSGRWSNDPGIWWLPAGQRKAVRVDREGRAPHFGADGDRLFFTEGDGWADKKRHLVGLRLSDRKRVPLATSEFATTFGVSPDGRWLAFYEGYDIWLTPMVAAGRPVSLGGKNKGLPLTRVSGDGGAYLHWSTHKLHWSLGPTLWSVSARAAIDGVKGAATSVDLGMPWPADEPAALMALVGARIVTMRGDEVLQDGTVLWRGARIVAIGPRARVQVPRGALVLDGEGLTAMPGLVDVHNHGSQGGDGITPQQSYGNLSLLSFGVTTLHDPSNHTATIFAAAELQRAGLIVAPRIFSTGTILYGARSTILAKVDSLEDARRHMRRLKAWGAFSVKSYNQPRRDQRQQVLTAARELGMMVVPEGGALFMHNMTQVVDGHTGVEHAIPLATAYDDVLQLWGQSKVGYTPTLNVAYGGLGGENYWYTHTDAHAHERLGHFVPPFAIDPRARRPHAAPVAEYNHIAAATFATRLLRAGGRVQLGAHGQREGLGVHWELWSLAQGGMTPLEALRAGTLHGAAYLGLDKDIGSLEVGKLADMAIVAGQPDVVLRDSEKVKWTVLGGRVYDAATMDEIAPRQVKRPMVWWRRSGEGTGVVAPAGCGCGLGAP